MTEIQDRYRTVSGGFDTVISAIGPEQWATPTPCSEWNTRDVVAHVVLGHRRVIANVEGGEAEPLGADEDAKEAWGQVTRALEAITGEPTALTVEIDGPTGKMAVDEIVGTFVCMDVLVHTWDLARAVGADEHLDPALVQQAYDALKPMDAMIRQPGVFSAKVEPPAGAELQTEFLCFLGRRV